MSGIALPTVGNIVDEKIHREGKNPGIVIVTPFKVTLVMAVATA
jgi:hypothetical protein